MRVAAVVVPLMLVWGGWPAPSQCAHPVPRRAHDRTIEVLLLSRPNKDRLLIQVRYRLEVDEFTVVFDDLPAVGDKIDLKKLREPREFYEAYTALYAPVLAGNLLAKLDDQVLTFTCRSSRYTLRDERNVPLGHLRYDFVFETIAAVNPELASHRLKFREGNYEFEEGSIRLGLGPAPTIAIDSRVEPDAALKEKSRVDLGPGEEAKLRLIDITFHAGSSAVSERAAVSREPASTTGANEASEQSSLLALLLDDRRGFLVILALAAGFGAAHALTPGHGKTLVAAYLVGEHGTAFHAVILGLVTTITHTGAVIVLAAVLLFIFPKAVPADMQMLLGFVGGLLIAGMGAWLLLRRLGGGADHFHIGGGHHHHGPPKSSDGEKVGWMRLVILGISGGIVPCWDAVIMLGCAISVQRLWLALPLLLAFSAGLASVLIIIGLGVIYLKGYADARVGQSRLVQLLPLASALVVTAIGLGLCYDSVHARRVTAPTTSSGVTRSSSGA
jgi:nickel/cobalt transporter (NicO) family protein